MFLYQFPKKARGHTMCWWWLVAVGGGWWLGIGGQWRLAVVGGWRRLAVGGPLGRSLRAVRNKKIQSLKDPPGLKEHPPGVRCLP